MEQYLYPVLEGGEGLYHHQVTWGKQVAKDGFFMRGSENLQ